MAKKDNAGNFKGLKMDELKKKLGDFEERVRAIRFKAEGAKSKNVKESATLRKQIARVLTEMSNTKKQA